MLFFWGSLFIMNEIYLSGLKRICKKNIEVVDAVFDTHLKLIAAHGVDMKKAIDYYTVAYEGKVMGADVRVVS